MEPDKTPGTDGLPADFYKVFWNDISDYLVNSINYAFGKGQLSVTQRRGIIKLIPKKDAEPDLIKNWHPITLLNRPFYSCELSYLAMNASEAGGDLVLIQTSLLFSCKCQLVSIRTT